MHPFASAVLGTAGIALCFVLALIYCNLGQLKDWRDEKRKDLHDAVRRSIINRR